MAHEEFAGCFREFEWPWYMPAVEAYRELVREPPFREAEVWGEVADRHFPDAPALVRWIDQPSLVPFLRCLDGEARQRFRDEVVRRMIEATLQPDGRCFETFRRVNLLARK